MSPPESFSLKFIYFFCCISYGSKVYPEERKCGRTHRHTDKSLLLTRTSGAGSRASAEQFVGSYDLVEFTLVLVGDTIRKSAIRPLKNGPRAHKSQLFNPQSFLHHGIIYCEDWNATAFLQYLDFQLYNNWMKEWKTNNCIISD